MTGPSSLRCLACWDEHGFALVEVHVQHWAADDVGLRTGDCSATP